MITVLGSINLDLTATAAELPEPGETVPGHGFATAPGGKGANQALAARRAGGNVRMAGAVGSDPFADQALAELKGSGVDLTGVRTADGATGIAMILVDDSGENVIVVVPGANGTVDTDLAEGVVRAMEPNDILLLQQEIPPAAISAAIGAADARGITTMLNIAPFIRAETELAHSAEIIVANETEFVQLIQSEFEEEGIERMAGSWARTHDKTLVITLGGKGAVAATPDGRCVTAPALKIEPVDTVGAGDTFCGYFAAGMQDGLDLEEALRRAAVAASLACLKTGAQPAIPQADEVEAAISKGSI